MRHRNWHACMYPHPGATKACVLSFACCILRFVLCVLRFAYCVSGQSCPHKILSQLDRADVITRLREIAAVADMSDEDNNATLSSGLTQALRALCDALQQNPHISRSIVYDELSNLLRTMPH